MRRCSGAEAGANPIPYIFAVDEAGYIVQSGQVAADGTWISGSLSRLHACKLVLTDVGLFTGSGPENPQAAAPVGWHYGGEGDAVAEGVRVLATPDAAARSGLDFGVGAGAAATPTTTTLTASPNPAALNQPVAMHAAVDTASGNGIGHEVRVADATQAAAPSGTAVVSDGTSGCTAVVVAGSGDCTLIFAIPGTRMLAATYGDGFDFAPSAGTTDLSVVAATSGAVAAPSANRGAFAVLIASILLAAFRFAASRSGRR